MSKEQTVKEKGHDLLSRFEVRDYSEAFGFQENREETRNFALACCEEVIKVLTEDISPSITEPELSFWRQVKEEIKKY